MRGDTVSSACAAGSSPRADADARRSGPRPDRPGERAIGLRAWACGDRRAGAGSDPSAAACRAAYLERLPRLLRRHAPPYPMPPPPPSSTGPPVGGSAGRSAPSGPGSCPGCDRPPPPGRPPAGPAQPSLPSVAPWPPPGGPQAPPVGQPQAPRASGPAPVRPRRAVLVPSGTRPPAYRCPCHRRAGAPCRRAPEDTRRPAGRQSCRGPGRTQLGCRRSPDRRRDRPARQSDWLDRICPYLLSEDGTYRSSQPDAGHRCTAQDPPATLAARVPGALLPLGATRPLRDVQGRPVGPLGRLRPGGHPGGAGALRALQAIGPVGPPGARSIERQQREPGSRLASPAHRGGHRHRGAGRARLPDRACCSAGAVGRARTGRQPVTGRDAVAIGRRRRPRQRPPFGPRPLRHRPRSGIAPASGPPAADGPRIEYEVQEDEALIAIAETFGTSRRGDPAGQSGHRRAASPTPSPATSSSCPSRRT